MSLNIQRLRYLCVFDAAGAVPAAAEALQVTTVHLRNELRKLENEAGTPLIEHVGRKLRLNEAGKRLVIHANKIVDALKVAEEEMRLGSKVGGDFTVGTFQTGASTFLADAIVEMNREHPEVRVRTIEGDPGQNLVSLRAGTVDLALGYVYPSVPLTRDGAIDRQELFVDPLVLLVPAGEYPDDGEVPLAEMKDRQWAAAPATFAYGAGVRRACQSAGFEPDVRYQTYDVSVMETLVARGLAVAIVPRLGLAAHPLPAGVEAHRIDGRPLARKVFLATRVGRRTKTQEAVVQAVVDAARQHDNVA